jgi:plasmid stabilization system protein ParE
MARTVIWTETALRDLDEAAEFIARDSKFYAAAFVKEARQAARSLKRFAERGRIVPEVGKTEIRDRSSGGIGLSTRLKPPTEST